MRTEPTPEQLRIRGLRLERATNAWNAMEVVVTIWLGWQARSHALVAFGLDSLVEILASTVVIWNLRDDRADPGDRRIPIPNVGWSAPSSRTPRATRSDLPERSLRAATPRRQLSQRAAAVR
jgi:hypothetical protein